MFSDFPIVWMSLQKLKRIRLEAEFCARSEYGIKIFVERLVYEL